MNVGIAYLTLFYCLKSLGMAGILGNKFFNLFFRESDASGSLEKVEKEGSKNVIQMSRKLYVILGEILEDDC